MSTAHDFDFFFGDWDVANSRLADFLDPDSGRREFTAVTRCWSLFDGAANIDEMDCPSEGFKGLTLRLFDQETKEWSLNWSSSPTGKLFPPVTGGFGDDGRGVFHGDDAYDGRPVRVRFIWSGISATAARWEQAFATDTAADGEPAWVTNWVMEFTRRPASGTPGA